MKIEIHDVGHGGCAVIETPVGKKLMVDCGHNSDPANYWWPSVHYYGHAIDLLAVTNLDEDHLSDFGDLIRATRVQQVLTNLTIDAPALAIMKSNGEMGRGTRAFHSWLGGGSTMRPIAAAPADLSPLQYRAYNNRFGSDFARTNDLSVVLVVQFGSFKILFSGDLENPGWRRLLQRQDFQLELLGGINVFVASHHGRVSGCCEEIFNYCRPDIFIISDGDKQFDSQETSDWYKTRANGITDFTRPEGLGYGRRWVLTTRQMGHLRIAVEAQGRYRIDPFQVHRVGSTLLTSGFNALRAIR
jgi:beta-lactamase superfamily II metal-dependent hydrolase